MSKLLRIMCLAKELEKITWNCFWVPRYRTMTYFSHEDTNGIIQMVLKEWANQKAGTWWGYEYGWKLKQQIIGLKQDWLSHAKSVMVQEGDIQYEWAVKNKNVVLVLLALSCIGKMDRKLMNWILILLFDFYYVD